ncbi:MAG: UDP-N-acetylglucosamine 2-epimerase (non-hydrolyzing) [Bacteroidetes bacterium]|nr:UDP-N-acetylglucosamine 2-epimerase (non-hydrolyzing) [Bacteroidota bacterium]
MAQLKKKILLAYGTRPELIKLVPLIFELKKRKTAELLVVNTGQHKEMVTELETIFSITPDVKFNVMTHDQSLNNILSNIVGKANDLFSKFNPDIVVVQGDTTTVLSMGIAAFNRNIHVAHVEAGLRSADIYNPYPEEFNRRVISLFARYNFVPTVLTAKNLRKENVRSSTIFITGNTVVDSLHLVLNKTKQNKTKNTSTKKRILITAHRRENHGRGIESICNAVIRLLKTYKNIEFVWPVHPNPNVAEVVYSKLGKTQGVNLCAPLSYIELIKMMRESYLIWTDSGGIQEEAPTLKKPVLILRSVTERPEVIASGFGKLIGTNTSDIVNATIALLNDTKAYNKMISGKNPFGDGKASIRIADTLLKG